MCLDISKNAKPKIATKDIVCYKLVQDYFRLFEQTQAMYRTPFQGVPIEIGNTYNAIMRVRNLEEYDIYGVEEGLHSCATLKDAINLRHDTSAKTIVKCIIPKGAKYFSGYFSVWSHSTVDNNGNLVKDVNSYASNQLTYVELINI